MSQHDIIATYGTANRFISVTCDLIKHFKVDNKIIIPKKCVLNKYFGDPHQNQVKFLLIDIAGHQYAVKEDHIVQNL